MDKLSLWNDKLQFVIEAHSEHISPHHFNTDQRYNDKNLTSVTALVVRLIRVHRICWFL